MAKLNKLPPLIQGYEQQAGQCVQATAHSSSLLEVEKQWLLAGLDWEGKCRIEFSIWDVSTRVPPYQEFPSGSWMSNLFCFKPSITGRTATKTNKQQRSKGVSVGRKEAEEGEDLRAGHWPPPRTVSPEQPPQIK